MPHDKKAMLDSIREDFKIILSDIERLAPYSGVSLDAVANGKVDILHYLAGLDFHSETTSSIIWVKDRKNGCSFIVPSYRHFSSEFLDAFIFHVYDEGFKEALANRSLGAYAEQIKQRGEKPLSQFRPDYLRLLSVSNNPEMVSRMMSDARELLIAEAQRLQAQKREAAKTQFRQWVDGPHTENEAVPTI